MGNLKRIWRAVSMSKLFAILIAAAMLFAPFATQSGAAMAAMPSDNAQMMDQAHCEGQPATDKDSKSGEKPCCAAMCTAAVAVGSIAAMQPQLYGSNAPGVTTYDFQFSYFGELPTPPPRKS